MNQMLPNFFERFEWYTDIIMKSSAYLEKDISGFASLLIFFFGCFVVVNAMALVGGLGTYAERKISADMQMRQGPNRVGPYGLLQFLADGVKMILKEDLIPRNADKFLFMIAPALCLVGVFAMLAVLPFSSAFILSDLNVGILYLLGVSSLVGVGIFLGGYASNSKWSMLGGMRGASQIISYEIPVTLSIVGVIFMTGDLSLSRLVEVQGAMPYEWNILHNPFSFLSFFVFFIGILAETNRAPFDLPEAESELVSGYHTEYSGMRFGFFALAEYIEVFIVCGVAVALFLGGYNIPFSLGTGQFFIETLGLSAFLGEMIGQFLELGCFLVKTLALYYLVIVIRWTLPRLRVDQVMILCWKYLTPIALFNLIGVAVWMYVVDGQSFFVLLSKLL